jgi:hypothetical protein
MASLAVLRRSRLSKSVLSTLVEAGNVSYFLLIMQTFHTDTVIEKDGRLHLDNVPFSEGESVHVFVSSATTLIQQPLKGCVLKYEQPFAPTAEEEWEAAK